MLGQYAADRPDPAGLDKAGAESFPASDPMAVTGNREGDKPASSPRPPAAGGRPRRPVKAVLDGGQTVELDHGAVVIAAITSCTNTSNPEVMIAAALLAKKAAQRGLAPKPWVKTSLAPGSRVVMDYYDRAGLTPWLDKLGFSLVGYGCTTCIGNSGPLIPAVSAAIAEGDLAACSVLSGNRNFEGRIHPETKLNYLASPPLVVAYALAGTMDTDLTSDPLGTGSDGQPVYLRDIWPSQAETGEVIAACLRPDMYTREYAHVFAGDERWRSLPVPAGDMFAWDPASSYVRRPPFFDALAAEPGPLEDIEDARVLALLGDSVTTDHISPAGAIKADSPAGRYLLDHGVQPRDFNSYGSRRGNHEVMIRGTFANIRLRNRLAPGTEGGYTRHLPGGEQMSIYDEAHLLDPAQLEEFRLMTNVEMDSASPFAGILIGQPTLARQLRMGVFAALDQRIATRYAIKPMDLAESAAYLRHHMTLAGREEPLFADDAVARLHRVSSGLPRALNNAATAALIAAAAAGQDLVDDACAKKAVTELTRD